MLSQKLRRLGELMHEFAALTSNLENEMIAASDNALGLEAKAAEIARLDVALSERKAEIAAASAEYASVKAKLDAILDQIKDLSGRA